MDFSLQKTRFYRKPFKQMGITRELPSMWQEVKERLQRYTKRR